MQVVLREGSLSKAHLIIVVRPMMRHGMRITRSNVAASGAYDDLRQRQTRTQAQPPAAATGVARQLPQMPHCKVIV